LTFSTWMIKYTYMPHTTVKSKNYSAFLRLDTRKYVDQYVVMIGGKVVRAGKDIERLLKEVRKVYPNKLPFVAKVPKRGVLVLFGV